MSLKRPFVEPSLQEEASLIDITLVSGTAGTPGRPTTGNQNQQ